MFATSSVNPSELGFDAGEGEGFEGLVVEFFDDVGGEALRNHAARAAGVDASATEIVDLFVAHTGGGAAVGALHLVGVDFEAGHGVCFGFVAHEEVATSLIGVGVMSAFVDEDEAGENGFSFSKKSVLKEEVASGVGCAVVLEGALIILLPGGGDGNGENLGVAISAIDGGVGLFARPSCANVDGAGLRAGIGTELGVCQTNEMAMIV